MDDAIAQMPSDPLLADALTLIRKDSFFDGITVLAPVPGGFTNDFVTKISKLGLLVRLIIASGNVAMPRRDETVLIVIEEQTMNNRKGSGYKTAVDIRERLLNETLNPSAPHPQDWFFDGPVIEGQPPPRRLMVPVPGSYRKTADNASGLAYEISCVMKIFVTAALAPSA